MPKVMGADAPYARLAAVAFERLAEGVATQHPAAFVRGPGRRASLESAPATALGRMDRPELARGLLTRRQSSSASDFRQFFGQTY